MLSEYFSSATTLQRVQACASATHLDGLAEVMRSEGYAQSTIRQYLQTAVHVSEWAQKEKVELEQLNEAAIEAFRTHLPVCECLGPRLLRFRHQGRGIGTQARRFLAHLRQTGSTQPAAQTIDPTPQPTLLVGFKAWMQQHRGAKPATLIAYGRIILDALQELGDNPVCYEAANLRAFVLGRSKLHGRSKAKLVVTAMRTFLRYLSAEGHCRPGLVGALPTIAHWGLSILPRYMSPSEVERIVGVCDLATTSGLRDRAVLLLLSYLGLRASDVALLHLSDIDWDQATVRVAGKSRRTVRLPLPQIVGDALLAYLEQGRPRMSSQRVFCRVDPPWKPIGASGVTALVARAMRKAGVTSPMKGAHVLRHSSAVKLLRDGASLDQIRVILRHCDPETTTIYAKVDTVLLQQVTQPWPEVMP